MVSVIVPVFNVEHYLRQCIESVLGQSIGSFELVLIDDGSTDRSPDICDRYAAQDTRVRVVHQHNRGLSASRNAGLAQAEGDFVCFLDADDWLDSETLEETIRTAERVGADVVLYPYVREYQGLSLPRPLFEVGEVSFEAAQTRDFLCRRMVGLVGAEVAAPEDADTLVTACCKLYRKALLDATKATFVDTALIGTEDALFNLHVFTEAKRAAYINRYFYHYRRDNDSSLTTRHRPALQKQWSELHERMAAHIRQNNLGPLFEEALRNRISLSIIGLGLNGLAAPTRADQLKVIDSALKTPEYRAAITTLDLRRLPLHWRILFIAARAGNTLVVYGLLRAMNELRRWRNRGRR